MSVSVELAGTLPPVPKIRVLLVEDDPDARDVYVLLLEAHGADVAAVGTVRDARAALEARAFDVLVSDIGLPDEDGYDLIAHVRAHLAGLPSVAITAYGGEFERERAIGAGFDEFLSKPFPSEDLWNLLTALARVCGESAAAF